ncbi:MAG TPA: glycosyltransferase family 39 protein [Terriglobales bacterium]|nr:glycosyltransferase family 39 protein [Terriglobales bacterium]
MATELGQKRTLASRFQNLSTIVWAAWLCRELAIFVGHTYRFSKLAGSFGFGWEGGRIAASIATGHGFSSPFRPGTGPTAWLAPLYPYLLAGIFKVFGVYTTASSIAILSINSIFSALTVIPVFYIAKRAFGRRVALWSAWLAALLPYAWYWAVRWAWETSLATLLLACVFLLTMRMAGLDSPASPSGDDYWHRRDWILYGLLWGLIALTNPSLLLWLPFSGIWLLHAQLRRGARAAWANALLSAAIFVALLAPWSVRNYRVFHRFIPIRGNLWVELHMGNGEDANGLWRFWLHPSQNPQEFAEYKQMGEVVYVQSKKREVLQFIRSEPGKFAELCLKRAIYYWYDVPRDAGSITGSLRNIAFLFSSILTFGGLIVMWRRRNRATFLFGSLLLAVPLIYYVTFPHPRYRAPIEPEMLILMVYLFTAAETRKLAKRSNPAMAGTAYQQS